MTRLSININAETAGVLRRLQGRGISFTEAVRRAIAVYDFVLTETARGRQIQSVGDGTVRELTLLP